MPKSFKRMARKAGLPPGSLIYTGEKDKEHLLAKITVTRYNEQDFREDKFDDLTECPLADDQGEVTWINISGIHQVKDLEKGLLDFPSVMEGQDVLLCWKLGEKEIGYWHTPEDGFAGRKPLAGRTGKMEKERLN